MAEKEGKESKETVTLSKEEKEVFDAEEAADSLHKNPGIRIYMLLVWLTVTGIMVWFMYGVSVQYIQSTPSSSITIDDPTELPMPAVVVCNWNQDGSIQNSTPTGNCPECLLNLEYCYNWNSSTLCTEQWTHTPIQTYAGLFDCWSYNIDPINPQLSNTTGYSGSLAVVFSVELLPLNIMNRAGAQVTFGVLNTSSTEADSNTSTSITPYAIYNEIRFAPVGKDTFYALTYVITTHYELPENSSKYNTSRFDTVSSLTTIVTPNDTKGYIGVSYSYETLSRREEIFIVGYSLTNVFGDFANMVNTLMGLDCVKVSCSVPLIYLALKVRTVTVCEDHYTW